MTATEEIENAIKESNGSIRDALNVALTRNILLKDELKNAYRVIADYQDNIPVDDSDCGELLETGDENE